MNTPNILPIVANDAWLKPVEAQINHRHWLYEDACTQICNSYGSLCNYANAYQYFGFQYDAKNEGWYFREWLPRALEVYLIGDFNNWEMCRNPLQKKENGVWEIFLPSKDWENQLLDNSRIKLYIRGENGWQERIPAYIRATTQNEETNDFAGLFVDTRKAFDWSSDNFNIAHIHDLFIYECHIGMAQDKPAIGGYTEFTEKILPRIKSLGYTALQIMAIAEHPYYGSFGYQVSNFYAPSSRFGSPNDLKELIKTAHQNGIAVIMDIVHSHFVSNLREGLNMLDGTEGLYEHAGERGNHPHWKSKLFNYGKEEVRRFLLSNIRYWMEEFHVDGFRFDGVTSMLYTHHGYVDNFGTYENYFGKEVDNDAITYLSLANKLIHEINPKAVSIAEEVSGMPGVAMPLTDGGMGFDFRMAMAIPDFWIKLLKTQQDEDWDIGEMWRMMTERLWNVKTVTYCESHDQAMVGDQTIAFRLMGKAMYDSMDKSTNSIVVDRGIALHKMIRLFSITLGGQAYLNFMGNEFGHPEWIDFPRQGNNWSYEHARRQWSLADDKNLRFEYLLLFDKAMIQLVKDFRLLEAGFARLLNLDYTNQTIVFAHGDLLFLFNWSPANSIADYIMPACKAGKYKIILNTDNIAFGGTGRVDESTEFFTFQNAKQEPCLIVYNINRTAQVWQKVD